MENKEGIVEKLIELQDLTNKIIDKLQYEKGAFNEAINWGNLKCIETNFCINQRGFEYYIVSISEASPDVIMFKNEVYSRLIAIWNKPLVIQTEW